LPQGSFKCRGAPGPEATSAAAQATFSASVEVATGFGALASAPTEKGFPILLGSAVAGTEFPQSGSQSAGQIPQVEEWKGSMSHKPQGPKTFASRWGVQV